MFVFGIVNQAGVSDDKVLTNLSANDVLTICRALHLDIAGDVKGVVPARQGDKAFFVMLTLDDGTPVSMMDVLRQLADDATPKAHLVEKYRRLDDGRWGSPSRTEVDPSVHPVVALGRRMSDLAAAGWQLLMVGHEIVYQKDDWYLKLAVEQQ